MTTRTTLSASYLPALLSLLTCLLSSCGPATSTPPANPANTLQPPAPPLQAKPDSEAGTTSLLPLLAGELVDLSHPFDEHTIYWPTEPGFRFEPGKNGVTAKGYYYAANRFATAEHGGTHLDAPIHFAADHHTADQIELDRLIGEGVVIDVRASCERDPDYLVGVGDLRAWEETHHRMLDNVIVLLRTGWSEHWPNRLKYLGTEARGAEGVAQLHFPGLAPEAARWLVEHRRIKAIGIDTASIDFGQSTQFEAHVQLCTRDVPIFENVTNLDRLPAHRFVLMALPMKIAGGSGGPLRIVALLPSAASASQQAP